MLIPIIPDLLLLDGAGEDGTTMRWGSSPRSRAGFYTSSHIHTCCAIRKKWVSAIHMLLMALIPTSEVSGKLSTHLGKTGGGPASRAVVREMFSPRLDPCANLTLAALTGRQMPRGVLNTSVTSVPVCSRKAQKKLLLSNVFASSWGCVKGGTIKTLYTDLILLMVAGGNSSNWEN